MKVMDWGKGAGRPLAGTFAVMAGAIVVGVTLRLIWPLDVEYKEDEAWLFHEVQTLLAGAPWPWEGMKMSVGLPNPGMSVWMFWAIGAATDASTPPELAQGLQVLNSLALLTLVLFIILAIPVPIREGWLWGAAIWAVNPISIILARKIWQASILPLPSVAFLVAWWFRHRMGGGVILGIAGAWLAQIHMSGGFLVIAVVTWTWLYEGRAFPWRQWILGSSLGLLPALPWICTLFSAGSHIGGRLAVPIPVSFMEWITVPFGLDIPYTLGSQTFDYWRGPLIAGYPTFAMAGMYMILFLLATIVWAHALKRVADSRGPWSPKELFIGGDESWVVAKAGLWGFCGLMTLLSVVGPPTYRHYMICATPLMMLFCAKTVLDLPIARKRLLLGMLVSVQALASFGLLVYIHQTQIIEGKYGSTWRSQQPHLAVPGGLSKPGKKPKRSLLQTRP